MAVIYATLIIKGKKTFAEVPAVLKDKVKEILIDLEVPELAEYNKPERLRVTVLLPSFLFLAERRISVSGG